MRVLLTCDTRIFFSSNRSPMYGAQNEAYKCPLFENVVNDLCFS